MMSPKKLKTPEKFETEEAANRRQRLLIKKLRRSKQADSDDLADLLERCLNGDIQCNSAACIICARRLRLDWLRELTPFFLEALQAHKLTFVLPEFMVPIGKLHLLDLKKIKQRFQRLLRRFGTKNVIFIGSIDVSLNSYENADFHWCPHIDVLVFKMARGPSIEKIKPTMRAAVDRLRVEHVPRKVYRPLKVREVVKGKKSSAATYSFKAIYEWRSGYWKTKNLPSGRGPFRATRGLGLKDHEVELRLWLSQWALLNRLILVGASNPGSPDFIRLRQNSRSLGTRNNTKGKHMPKCVTRSNKVSREKGRKRIKGARPRGKMGR